MSKKNPVLHLLQEFSIPLILGIVIAIVWANTDYHSYHYFLEHSLGFQLLGHKINWHFIVNDIFMVFFFGIAAVEITTSVLPGGALNPISKAVNPLFGTIGGVLGPILAFWTLCHTMPVGHLIGMEDITMDTLLHGWGIPTATDIALAWLVARMIFGSNHPAVTYLLLLAVADDAIGLGIIAIFYPDPAFPVAPIWLLSTLAGILLAYIFRIKNIRNMWLYIMVCGGLSWFGLIQSHLHPALALVVIIPFLPADIKKPHHHERMFDEDLEDHSPLVEFEHRFKIIVDLGLFCFGLANAGVVLSGINSITWIIFLSLLIGKTIGITFMGYVGHLMGAKLPQHMNFINLMVVGIIGSLGLTVALFVSGEAYSNYAIFENAAKMGALFSVGAGFIAYGLAKIFKIEKHYEICCPKKIKKQMHCHTHGTRDCTTCIRTKDSLQGGKPPEDGEMESVLTNANR